MVNHLPENWKMKGGGHCIHVRCPRYFIGVLAEILSGWSITKSNQTDKCAVTASFVHEGYLIDSLVLLKPSKHNEIMNALNEFLVNLAYVISGMDRDTRLLHCAGFFEHGEMNIVVGAKNRGKSALVYKKACEGKEIVADDLLIWQPKTGKFFALGFPLRLRRPVLPIDGRSANPDNFFAGDKIAYSKKHAYDIAQVGKSFLLDQLWELDQRYTPRSVPILQTAVTLEKFIIGPEYTTVIRERLE